MLIVHEVVSIPRMSAVVVTIGLALAGYVVTYLNRVRLAQRQERLARVNRQLASFYGPLFALTEANSRTFAAFVERHARPVAGHRSPVKPRRLRKSSLSGVCGSPPCSCRTSRPCVIWSSSTQTY